MTRILLSNFLLYLTVFFTSTVWAQDRTITGKVSSKEDGATLPGVNVVVKGTTLGTSTDVNGTYKIQVPTSATALVFSFVGFQNQEVVIGNRSVIDVELLADNKLLNEVVVTAVGIERNTKMLSYSVEQVASDKLVQKSEPDLLRALQGKVPGLNIAGSGGAAGSATRITIRGANSFSGNNQPLFVVDGIPFDNSRTETTNSRDNGAAYSSRAADIDPNNIASMTVLKGAAAAALYGTRAANGVIVITTKSGSTKSSRKGLEVAYTTSYSTESIANYPDFQNKYGAGSQQVYANANGTWGPAFGLGRTYNAVGGYTPNTTGTDSIPIWVGYNTYANQFPQLASQYGLRAGGNVAYQAYPNNVRDFFRTGNLFENSISVTGGSAKSSITAVLSAMKQQSYFPGSDFSRYNISVGGNTTLDNGLIVGANLSYINSVQNSPLFGANGTSPLSRMFQMPRNWPLNDLPSEDPNGVGVFFFPFGQADNPIWSVNNSIFNSTVQRVVASFSASYDFNDWLNLTYKIGTNAYGDTRLQRIAAGSLSGAQGLGSINQDQINFQEIESNLLLNINRKLTEDITLKAIIGHNVNQRTTDQRSVTSLGIISRGIDLLTNTNSVQALPSAYSRRRLWAVFGDVTLSYKEIAALNFTIRNDNSSTLPVGKRNYAYYAASASFSIVDAMNLKSDLLNVAKLRLGYARVGRDAAPYQVINTYNINFGQSTGAEGSLRNNDFPFNGQAGASANPIFTDVNLKPEFTNEIEAGLNLGILKNRVSLDVTYYNRLTTDVIANRSVPRSTGYFNLTTNFGSIRNKGWEVGLNIVPVSLDNGLKWDIYTAFTRNRNIVESLTEGVQEIVLRNLFSGNTNVVPVVRPGEQFGVLRGTYAARDAQGNLLIDPNTGLIIQSLDTKIIGNPNPDYILGITNTISYKGFSLSGVIDYRHGGQIFSWTNQFLLGRGVTRDTENREVPKIVPGVLGNPNTLQPILGADGQPIRNNIQVVENNLWFQAGGRSFAINGPDETQIFDATTIRLREITLAYEFPKSWLSKTPFGSANLSLSGRNLWFRSPNMPQHTRMDPEVNTFGNTNTQGIDFFAAPSTRRFGVNLRITF
jgi:TonB-linked SusC/RagA family outer membrane protein